MLMRSPDALPEPEQAWRGLAGEFSGFDHLLLAVSGGPDSLAMLVGMTRLRAAGLLTAELFVVTVDHALRPESSAEAQSVADLCDALGVAHHTVRLAARPVGVNLQGWARGERYRVMADLLREKAGNRAGESAAIVTAHMAEDQAETFLMRASRGTGSDGLAGIRPAVRLEGVHVIRPFLAWPRGRLHLALAGTGLKPAFDPSNADPSFTRVRYRDWLANGPTPDNSRSIALGFEESARIAQLESQALDVWAERLFVDLGAAPDGLRAGKVDVKAVPLAVLARLMRLAMASVSRQPDAWQRLDLARMIGWSADLQSQGSGKVVCAGAVLQWEDSAGSVSICAYAEAGRSGFPSLTLAPGESSVWDERFAVTNNTDIALSVRAAAPGDSHSDVDGFPAVAWQSLPVATDGDEFFASVPKPSSSMVLQWLEPALRKAGRLDDGGTMPQGEP
ncbi:MAG: tRNA lysidine(34) synthetase TilS [Cohaesibacteraceae bacterium]